MGCALDRLPATTPAQLRLDYASTLDALGHHAEAAEYRALAGQILNEAEHGPWIAAPGRPARRAHGNDPIPERTIWVHGEGIEPCGCGFVADYLCDYPTGGGATCDAPLCEACRTHGASARQEWDWCPQHAAREHAAIA